MRNPAMDTLRIDSWLHHVRLASTRAHARELCEGGKVQRNGVRVKPSTRVIIGDRIEVSGRFGPRVFEVRGCPANRVGAPRVSDYVHELTPPEVIQTQETARRVSLGLRDRGSGRPTKRDRRRIERWLALQGVAGEGEEKPQSPPD